VDWYYIRGTEQTGPVPDSTLADLALRGEITPETLLWRAGMQDWAPARIAAPELTAAVSAPDGASAYGSAGFDAPTAQCMVCGTIYPAEEVIYIGQHLVCAACKPLYLQRLREGVPLTGAQEVRFGGFWPRLAAKIIDGIILAPASFVLMLVLGFLMVGTTGESEPNPFLFVGYQVLMNGVMWGINMVYVTLFVGRFGATPGKMVCRLRVVTADMQEMTYLRAFARFWGEFVTGMTFGIGYIIAAFDSEKRALHDYICNTRVIGT